MPDADGRRRIQGRIYACGRCWTWRRNIGCAGYRRRQQQINEDGHPLHQVSPEPDDLMEGPHFEALLAGDLTYPASVGSLNRGGLAHLGQCHLMFSISWAREKLAEQNERLGLVRSWRAPGGLNWGGDR